MTAYLDTETTGLDSDDEIIEIAIVDAEGQVLLNTLVRPTHLTEWPEAQAINGISPAMVADAPLLADIEEAIEMAVAGEDVVIYNAAFDAGFLGALLRGAVSIKCCMLDFAEVYGDRSDYWGNYTWQLLATAANHVGFAWPANAHRARADALACRAVWRYLRDPDERARIDAIRNDKSAEKQAVWELRWWEERSDRERRQFEDAQSERLLRRIGMRKPGDNTCEGVDQGQLRRDERIENATLAFTGFSGYLWAKLYRYIDTAPVYRQRPAIPAGLLTRSALQQQGREAWVNQALVPEALYLSRSGKIGSYLYTQELVNRMIASEPLRACVAPRSGMVHLTATELRKTGVDETHFMPVAERYSCIGHCGYYLYEIESKRFDRPDA